MGNLALLSALLFSTFAAAKTAKPEGLSIFPAKTIPGGLIAVRYPLLPEETEATYLLTINGKEKSWEVCPTKRRAVCTFVGVEMDNTPATLEVVVKKAGAVSAEEVASQVVKVEKKKYPKTQLKIAPSHAELSPEDQKRMETEKATMKQVYESGSKSYLWEKPFRLPGTGEVTSLYGGQRVFNGKLASTHYGVDLRGNEKTWVLASNAGRVLFADNLFNGGNFIVVDHGGKMFTTYAHLSSFEVKANEMVKAGQRLGHVGSTGRVTGPHLHWGVRIDGLSVDPMIFLKVAKKLN